MFTYGLELEFADWDKRIPLDPELGVYDMNETSIVNSNGEAVDPYNPEGRGVEINVKPCYTIASLKNKFGHITRMQTGWSINYSCWMHVHIGGDFNVCNLELMKWLLEESTKCSKEILELTNITPARECESMTAEMRRRRNKTRSTYLNPWDLNLVLESVVEEEFWRRLSNHPRCMINLRSLLYHGTIEFRFFYMTDNPAVMASTVQFCDDLVTQWLFRNPTPIPVLLEKFPYMFPKPLPFDTGLEIGWEKTKVPNRKKTDNITKEVLNEDRPDWYIQRWKNNHLRGAQKHREA